MSAAASLDLYISGVLAIQSIVTTNNLSQAMIWWNSSPNNTYQLEATDVLSPTNWQPIPGSVTAVESETFKAPSVSNGTSLLYYRVRKL